METCIGTNGTVFHCPAGQEIHKNATSFLVTVQNTMAQPINHVRILLPSENYTAHVWNGKSFGKTDSAVFKRAHLKNDAINGSCPYYKDYEMFALIDLQPG